MPSVRTFHGIKQGREKSCVPSGSPCQKSFCTPSRKVLSPVGRQTQSSSNSSSPPALSSTGRLGGTAIPENIRQLLTPDLADALVDLVEGKKGTKKKASGCADPVSVCPCDLIQAFLQRIQHPPKVTSTDYDRVMHMSHVCQEGWDSSYPCISCPRKSRGSIEILFRTRDHERVMHISHVCQEGLDPCCPCISCHRKIQGSSWDPSMSADSWPCPLSWSLTASSGGHNKGGPPF